ncbi:hypothetical protein [Methylomonas sp. MgM2]
MTKLFERLFRLPVACRRSSISFEKYWLLVPVFCCLAACGDLYLDAPHGSNISLMPKDKPAVIEAEQVVWFKYWGNEPFSAPETHAATIIEAHHLFEARIRMVNTFADALISMFTGPFGFPRRTLIVEGNPQASDDYVAANPSRILPKP